VVFVCLLQDEACAGGLGGALKRECNVGQGLFDVSLPKSKSEQTMELLQLWEANSSASSKWKGLMVIDTAR
jgi:hypothetical protein